MTPFSFVVVALGVWRIARMLSLEAGPGDIFNQLRIALGAKVRPKPIQAQDQPDAWYSDRFLGQLILCPFCLSVWLSPLMLGLWLVGPDTQVAVVVIAVSGASSALELYVGRH